MHRIARLLGTLALTAAAAASASAQVVALKYVVTNLGNLKVKTLAFALLVAAIVAAPTRAQTPEQQRQEQQRVQQLMNENARRQQEESRRDMQALTPKAEHPPSNYGAATGPSPGGRAAAGPAGAQLEQARQTWLKRPPLAPQGNPLIGVWTRPGSPTSASNDPFAQLGAMMKGGLCEVLFSSDGMFEFKPASLVGIDKRTRRADTLDQVEYRGDAKRVAVIPKTTLKLMVFDVESPNRIQWAGQNCTMVRVGAAAQTSRR